MIHKKGSLDTLYTSRPALTLRKQVERQLTSRKAKKQIIEIPKDIVFYHDYLVYLFIHARRVRSISVIFNGQQQATFRVTKDNTGWAKFYPNNTKLFDALFNYIGNGLANRSPLLGQFISIKLFNGEKVIVDKGKDTFVGISLKEKGQVHWSFNDD